MTNDRTIQRTAPSSAGDSASGRRRRRRLLPRFGLRTLFVVAVLFCLLSAWVGRNIHRSRQEDAAIEALMRADAGIYLHGDESFGAMDEEDFDEYRAGRTALLDRAMGTTSRTRIRGIVLDDRRGDPAEIRAGVEALPDLPEIEQATLYGTLFDDATCEKLSQLPNLEELTLSRTNVGERGLTQLDSLSQLRTLGVSETSTNVLSSLPRLARLRKLTLFDLSISREEMAGIAKLPDLRSLELLFVRSQAGEEETFRPLAGAAPLRSLCIVSGSFSDDDLPSIGRLQGLERLTLPVRSDESLVHFAGLSDLRRLDLMGSVTPDAVRRFSAARPELLVVLRRNLAASPAWFRDGESVGADAANVASDFDD